MATLSLTDATIWAAGYDMTTDLNSLQVSGSADELDDTTFGDSYRSRIGGLRDVQAQLSGYWQAGASAVDSQAFTNLGTADRVFSFSATGDDGDPGYMMRGAQFTYQMFGDIGTVTPFQLGVSGSNGQGLVRGNILHAKGNVSGAANGTGRQLGAVAADEYLYTAIHVFSAGTTADVIVESDDNSGFTSATTRSTTTVTAAGGTWVARVAGAITDDWWRVRFANVTGTFSIGVLVGIQ